MVITLEVREAGHLLGSYEISANVCRIGSDSSNAIAIEGLESHALTLQSQGDGYCVFNRTARTLQLNEKPLAAGTSKPWKPGQVLTVGDEVELELKSTVAAHPARTVECGTAADPQRSTNDRGPSQTGNSGSVKQKPIVMGILLLFGCFLLGTSNASTATVDEAFSRLIHELSYAPYDARLVSTKTGLQVAYDLEIRNYRVEAVEKYSQIRRLLLSKRSTHDKLAINKKVRNIESQALSFVRSRLGRIR